MGVFVDDMRLPKKVKNLDRVWSHMGADSLEEMHQFARKLGLKRSYFQISSSGIPHYDVTEKVRAKAVKMGAEELTTKELYQRLIPLRIKRSQDNPHEHNDPPIAP